MARPSKTQQFEIYEDGDTDGEDVGDIPAERAKLGRNDSAYGQDGQSQKEKEKGGSLREGDAGAVNEAEEEEEEDDIDTTCLVHPSVEDAHAYADDERRHSVVTSTSISSLPESAFETDYEGVTMHQPYTPPMIRPSFRRPESVRRMQMSSPTPSERSLRRSVLSPPRARTPRSNRSSVKGSPRPRRVQEVEVEEDRKDYPLVLLHVSLLPVELRWSTQSMQEILPTAILESLQLLKSKVSETVTDRGILIPHPREEYELLEERLLEALELKKERVTKCGHFRARESTSSTSSADSGIATSVESLSEDFCSTCHHHLRPTEGVISSDGRKWSIKVFASNGLMRASAWTAAWSEMESVDVEILPWIGEDLRKKLDERALEEEAELRTKQESEDERIKEMAEQQIRLAREERRMMRDVRKSHYREPSAPEEEKEGTASPAERVSTDSRTDDLPQVYRPKDIPLSLLLKNYFYLLARDKRNIVIFALVLLTSWMSLGAAVGPGKFEASPMPPSLRGASVTQMLPLDTPQASSSSSDISVATSSSTAVASAAEPTVDMPTTTLSARSSAASCTTWTVDPAMRVTKRSNSKANDGSCVNTASVHHLFGPAGPTLASGPF